MRVAFIGLKQAGKSTAAAYWASNFGGVHVDTSESIYEALATQLGLTVQELREKPKESLRELLIATGDALCADDPLGCVRSRLSDQFAVAGIRKRDQIAALPENTTIVWVERSNHVPDGVDNLELSKSDADYVLENNGFDLAGFFGNIYSLFAVIQREHRQTPR